MFFLYPRDSSSEVVQNIMKKSCKGKTKVSSNNWEKNEENLSEEQSTYAARKTQKQVTRMGKQ